ncbi:P-loop containing nucleoside triphosphate hydrolase protein [Mycena olivaceomarginata]|nr:P-loop containing nucleoside triphosphate hydrolase protein [Mycena olivaceomarginata]
MAGSGIRGQFEEKFRGLIQDIEAEAGNVICFIDELHTLFNLGKTEGSIDGGQMIKQALSRGLQLVGATMPDEYRKTIGKDATLEHRFQPVQIEEPTVDWHMRVCSCLAVALVGSRAGRGRRTQSIFFCASHGGFPVRTRQAIQTPSPSSRCKSQTAPSLPLPSTAHDKAIDLVDEAASSLRLAQESKPDKLEALDRVIMTLQIELESLKKESNTFSVERRSAVEAEIKGKRKEASKMYSLWQTERARLSRTKELKQRLEDAKHQLDVAQQEGDFEKSSRLRFSTIPELTEQLPDEKAQAGREEDEALWMLHERVTSNDISRVVAHATGIPVQNLLKGERDKLVHMEETLRRRVVGHDHAVEAVSDAVHISRAGLQAPNRPVASLLLLGPTGVGKTELCKALAGFLFNDEKCGFMLTNMLGRFHDRHTISRLIGAAPGYAGFEEGGQLTEAIRRKPYAVILLDELEKAHKVMIHPYKSLRHLQL